MNLLEKLAERKEQYHRFDLLVKESHDAILALQAALETSITAIDDWLNLYASDLCDEQRVQEARDRVFEHGTLWYIATTQKKNREALKLLTNEEIRTSPAGRHGDEDSRTE